MRRTSIFSAVLLLALAGLVSACRGISNTARLLPLSGGAAMRPDAQIAFAPIGPRHMTSGGDPNSGKVNAMALDPHDSKTAYVASGWGTGLETYSSAGVYKTVNGGASWQAIDDGLTDEGGFIASVVNALLIDPNDSSVLLAATEYGGIFRTHTAGEHWSNVYPSVKATQLASFHGIFFAATSDGILKSIDGGATWKIDSARQGFAATAFGVDPNGAKMYAGWSDGATSLLDGQMNWQRGGQLPYQRDTGTDGSTPAVHQMAVDPFTPTTVYASSNDGTWDQDLHSSTDGGRTWNRVLRNRYGGGLGTQAIAFSLVHPHRLYVGVDGGMLYITGDGSPQPALHNAAGLKVIDIRNVWPVPNGNDDRCWVASDQGLDDAPACSLYSKRSGDTVVTASMAIGLARRFVVTPDRQTVLTSLQDFDSHATFDGGATWHENYYLYEDGFNELNPADPSTCYALDEAWGFSVSVNGCRRYRSPGTGARRITPSRLMTTPIAFDPKNPKRMYVLAGAIVGFGTARRGAFLTTDNGANFKQLDWPFSRPGCIVVDARDGSHILVGDLRDGSSSLGVTFDGGKHWHVSKGVPKTGFWYAATISPADSKLVLATSVDASNNVFVLRSTDGGKTFTQSGPLANAPALRMPGEKEAFVYSPAREIRFNQDVKNGTPMVALTTLKGAFVSSDLGQTWTRVDKGSIAHSFWGIRWVGGYLYLGSDGQGVLVSTRKLQ